MNKPLLSFLFCFLLFSTGIAQQAPKREFRGAWIATYANIDWPNRTQTPQQQRSALITILDHHKATGINAVFIQVRSQSDAMYLSNIEPWSADLTGTQGKAPSPMWDPMQFAIEECHKRGIEFHAWINPYRAIANYTQINNFAPNHVARQHPEWLIASGNLRTLDPGIPAVRDHIIQVISDMVQRYDLDGIHFDDYFYPNAAFNDDATYNADPRGFTNRGDWRRDNVNLLIKRVNETIEGIKPWVKFGVSPSGIYMNKSTNAEIGSETSGLQHYVTLYADSRKWISEGWVDYIAPQVYWYIGQPGANYGVLIPWWNNQAAGRHIYIGMAGYKVNDVAQGPNWANPSQIPNQVRMNRSYSNIYGQAVYNTSSMRSSTKLGFRDSLRLNFYQKPALLPNMPWRDNTPPPAPSALNAVRHANDSVVLTWQMPQTSGDEMDKVKRLVIYRSETPQVNLNNAQNILTITPTAVTTFTDKAVSGDKTYYYTVTALDRFHNESAASNVTDNLPPTITCPPAQILAVADSCSATLPDYTGLAVVTDDVSTSSEITITQSPAVGTVVNGSVVTVSLTATDASGKSSTCSFEVNLKDQTAPVAITKNISRSLVNGSVLLTPEDVNDGSWDNCAVASLSLNKMAFDCSNIGENQVTLTVTDKSGNVSSATAIVTIEGVIPQAQVKISRTDNTFTGLPENTLALGYGARSLTLTAETNQTLVSDKLTYQWSPAIGLSSTNTASTEFIPLEAGDYTFNVLVTNEFGCTSTASVTIKVIDVRCGNKNDKVLVCDNTGKAKEICTAAEAVDAHLRKGGKLGSCEATAETPVTDEEVAVLNSFPNPFGEQTTVTFRLPTAQRKVTLEIYDLNGNRLKRLYDGNAEAGRAYEFSVDTSNFSGQFFIARLITPEKVYSFRLMKE